MHFLRKILYSSGAPNDPGCTRIWIRASLLVSSFGISLAHRNSNPGVLSDISLVVIWLIYRAPNNSNLENYSYTPTVTSLCAEGDTNGVKRWSNNVRQGKLREISTISSVACFANMFQGECEYPEGWFSPI